MMELTLLSTPPKMSWWSKFASTHRRNFLIPPAVKFDDEVISVHLSRNISIWKVCQFYISSRGLVHIYSKKCLRFTYIFLCIACNTNYQKIALGKAFLNPRLSAFYLLLFSITGSYHCELGRKPCFWSHIIFCLKYSHLPCFLWVKIIKPGERCGFLIVRETSSALQKLWHLR